MHRSNMPLSVCTEIGCEAQTLPAFGYYGTAHAEGGGGLQFRKENT